MISDETLILYFYGDDLTQSQRQHVKRELDQSPVLNARYVRLCNDMHSLSERMSEQSASVDKRALYQALQNQFDKENDSRLTRKRTLNRRGLALAATLLVFVAGVVIGSRMNLETSKMAIEPVTANRVTPSVQPTLEPARGSFVRGVATHFKSTQIQLASLDMSNPTERDALIQEIVSQNRFFLKAANQNDAQDVARLLRAFEPLLLSLSSVGQRDPSRSAEQIRAQLEFELGVSLTKMNGRASNRRNEFL